MIDAVFAGGIRPLPPEGHPSGIFKEAVAGPILLGPEGLQGDEQADRRVHGGPWKALHHYAAENYARLAAAFPAKAALFDWPGLAHAVVNLDDAQGAALAASLTGERMLAW